MWLYRRGAGADNGDRLGRNVSIVYLEPRAVQRDATDYEPESEMASMRKPQSQTWDETLSENKRSKCLCAIQPAHRTNESALQMQAGRRNVKKRRKRYWYRLVWKEGISTIHLIYELQTHWQRGRDGSLWHRAEAERGRGFSNVKVDRHQRQCVQNMRVPPNSVFATLTAEQVNTWH